MVEGLARNLRAQQVKAERVGAVAPEGARSMGASVNVSDCGPV